MAAPPSPTSSAVDLQTIAILTLSETTVTATVPPSTSGVAVIDGTTISFRHEGITLSGGEVFSLGFDGLVASTTTADYQYVSISSPSVRYDSTRHPSGTSIILTNSQDMSSTLPPDTPLTPTTTPSTSSQGEPSSQNTPLTSSGSQVSTGLTMSASTASSGTESSSGSMTGSGSMTTGTASGSNGAQEGPGNTNAAPLTTNGGGSGAPAQAQHVGFGGFFVAGLGLLVTLGAMIGL